MEIGWGRVTRIDLRQIEGARPVEAGFMSILAPGEIQIEVLGRCHHHRIARRRRIEPGLEAGPGEDGGIPAHLVAVQNLLPAQHPLALAGQVLLAVAQQVALQLAAILIPLLLHQLLAGGAVGPDPGGHLVSSHVHQRPREQFAHLVHHGFQEAVGAGQRRVEHVVVEILHRQVAGAVCLLHQQLGQRLDGGVAVTRDVNFRNDGDAEPGTVGHQLAHLALGVVAAVGLGAAAQLRPHRQGVTAPGGQLGQLGEGLDLESPPLVIGQVPVETVELVEAHQPEQALEGGEGVKVAGTVEKDAAKTEARCIAELDAGQALAVLQIPLGQADEAVAPTRLAAGGNHYFLRGDGQPVGLRAQPAFNQPDLGVVILRQREPGQFVEVGQQRADQGARAADVGALRQPEVAL